MFLSLWLHGDPEIQWRRDLDPRGRGPQEHRVWPVYMWQLGPRMNGPDNLTILSLSPPAIPASGEWRPFFLVRGGGSGGDFLPQNT